MEKIKIVNEESYNELVNYLNILTEATSLVYPLAFVYEDGKKYAVIRDGEEHPEGVNYFIAYEQDGKMMMNGAGYTKDAFDYWDDDYAYTLSTNAVIREKREYPSIEKLALIFDENHKNEKNENLAVFNYTQIDEENSTGCLQLYPIFHNMSGESYLYYIGRKLPSVVQLSLSTGLNKDSYYALSEEMYYKYKVTKSKKPVYLPFSRAHSPEEIDLMVRSLGFQSSIPQELVDIYQGNNPRAKTLKKVIDTYTQTTSY